MASTNTILERLEENFLTCPICLQQFTEPKLLPCLHRYCGVCLDSLITQKGNGDGELKCAECREAFTVPDEGFKTDYRLKSMIDFLTSENSGDNANCVGCREKQLVVVAYCFERKGFLCSTCFREQPKRRDRKSRPRFSSVVSIKKIARELRKNSLTHDKNSCVIDEFASLANRERQRLREKVYTLEGCMKYLDEIPRTTQLQQRLGDLYRSTRENLRREKYNAGEKLATFCSQLCELDKVISYVYTLTKVTGQSKSTMGRLFPRSREIMHENQMKLLWELTLIMEEGRRYHSKLIVHVTKKQNEFPECMKSLNAQHVDACSKIKKQGVVFQRFKERYNQISRLSSDILETQNDWRAVQKVRRVSENIEHLMKDIGEASVKTEFDILCSFSVEESSDRDHESCELIKAIGDILAEYGRDKFEGRGIGRDGPIDDLCNASYMPSIVIIIIMVIIIIAMVKFHCII